MECSPTGRLPGSQESNSVYSPINRYEVQCGFIGTRDDQRKRKYAVRVQSNTCTDIGGVFSSLNSADDHIAQYLERSKEPVVAGKGQRSPAMRITDNYGQPIDGEGAGVPADQAFRLELGLFVGVPEILTVIEVDFTRLSSFFLSPLARVLLSLESLKV